MKAFLTDLLQYTYRSNDAVILLLEKNEQKIAGKTITAISHTLNAHHVWINRIENEKPLYGIWDIHQIGNMGEFNKELLEKSLKIIHNHPLSASITYTNTKGETHQNTVQEILYHIINHSTYHRGQIMAQLREAGIEPVATDYVIYKR